MLLDSHAHLMHAAFKEPMHLLLERARLAGVEAIINICTNPHELEEGIKLAQAYPWIYTAAATTPHDVAEEGESAFPLMQKAAQEGLLVAIGETGLDYHYYAASKEIQKQFLRRYLRLAKACELPVVIHCREAFTDLFHILDEEYAEKPGVLHCFTGTFEEAQELIKRGWYLSFSGIVTFKKSQALQQIAKTMPLEKLLIETDAPYLAPAPYRGQQNEPAYLRATAQFLAALRAISFEALTSATRQNAINLFNL